jgi:tRNA A37 threonylcarbamoyladenosine modification protein TsaB
LPGKLSGLVSGTLVMPSAGTRIISGWDARMGEIYWGLYESDDQGIMQPQQADAICTLDQLDKKTPTDLGCTFAGNIFSDDTYPDARAMLAIAKQRLLLHEFVAPENAHPHYVRHVVYNHS